MGRAGEGRQTDYDPAQSRAVRREGGPTGRLVAESTAQILSLIPGLPHVTAVSLCGWVGFFISWFPRSHSLQGFPFCHTTLRLQFLSFKKRLSVFTFFLTFLTYSF